ncbi:dihydrolipoamide acetyltransferase family protein [Paenalcaligenes suwonensis]|uniref:dihydrolipoamide acetyltransferase family protein n=1 Tax=Paenalcaligenes suwonensis TaxID=1202713 RepID=UPI00140A4A99|nr:dihydrolipoamide acetyltransferase family protein [Paenalcaligenes suwonensis]NHC63050.1 2-oxo acid dehydrogenase subunit E2 [Paenalcaligenes suwonensis]
MGIHIIKMPDIGEGIAEVELVGWHVKAGDTVVEDQILADVMTDKATVEVPSPVSGVVVALGGEIGEVMAVGSELIRLEVEGPGNAGLVSASVETAEATPVVEAPKPVTATQASVTQDAPVATTPVASATRSAQVIPMRSAAVQGAIARPTGAKPLASPAVRKRAWELGIELQYVPASGPVGQITHQDLDAYIRQPAASAGDARAVPRATVHDDERIDDIPVIGLRRKIAQKMQEAKRRIPHFTYVEELDVTELENLRSKLNQEYGEDKGKLTLLPFIARAMVLAIRDFPQMNARYDDDAEIIHRYGAVHLGVATQTETGLMVPVVRHADQLDMWQVASETVRLARVARENRATRDELSGSTITLTSLGPLGGIMATPVINHPEVAIVGVNRIVERPVIKDGAVVARKMMNLSSSFDHRVVDGMDAAQFIQRIRTLLECPALLFVEVL